MGNAIGILADGTKSNKVLWDYIVKDLDLTTLLKLGGPKMEEYFNFKSGVPKAMTFSLQSVHNCTPKVGPEILWVVDMMPPNPHNTPAERLAANQAQKNNPYAVFCSNPDCGKEAPSDNAFAKCGRCHLM